MQSKFLPAWGVAAFLTASLPAPLLAQDQVVLDSDDKKYSYAVGSRIGSQLEAQFGQPGSGIDLLTLLEGLRASLGAAEPLMDETEITQVIQDRQRAELEAAAKVAMEAGAEGQAYMDENRGKEGVTETASGVQYAVTASGEGTSPGPNDTVVVHYEGTLIDGTVFDSSYSRNTPATFPVSGVIPGWTEVLQLMKPGDIWNVVIPPQLAYGERGAGNTIGPNETLLFKIELLEVK